MKSPIWFVVLLCLATVSAQAAAITEKEVLATMDAFKQAWLTGNAASFTKMIHPDITYSHSAGNTQDKSAVTKSFRGAKMFNYSDMTVRIHGNVALVKNVTDMRNEATIDTPNRLNVLYVWVKESDGWKLLARQPIRLPLSGEGAKGGAAAKSGAKKR